MPNFSTSLARIFFIWKIGAFPSSWRGAPNRKCPNSNPRALSLCISCFFHCLPKVAFRCSSSCSASVCSRNSAASLSNNMRLFQVCPLLQDSHPFSTGSPATNPWNSCHRPPLPGAVLPRPPTPLLSPTPCQPPPPQH